MTEESRRFDELVAAFYRAWFRYHPEQALNVGVLGYQDRLPAHDDDDIGALIALYEEALGALEECDVRQLDAERRLDHLILKGAAHIGWHELERSDWRLRDPQRFLPVAAIYQLAVRPVPNFIVALSARLKAVPACLRAARMHLAEAPELIPALWLQAAETEARAGAEFIKRLEHQPEVAEAGMHELLHAAAHALQDFARFICAELTGVARGRFAVGREHYQRLLVWQHGLPLGVDELYAFGQSLYQQTLEQLQALTRELRGDDDIAALSATLQGPVVDSANLLAHYRQQINAARAFVGRRGLVTLPARDVLDVVETPLMLRRQIPFVAYLPPMPTDRNQRGRCYVTSPEAGGHHELAIRHASVHQAWPGCHLQSVTSHQQPVARSLPRLLHPSATLHGGWALYCEQLMQEEGFLQGPDSLFMLLRDRLWHALRILVDIELHVHGISAGQATQRLASLPGFTTAQAEAEVSGCSRAPAAAMSYAVGWALINALRDEVYIEHPTLPIKVFHDRLLASGSIPLALVITHQFGEEMWQKVSGRVFA